MKAYGQEDLFDFVVGYPRLFGKGRAIFRILKKVRIEPRQFLHVGDEVRDVEAAKQAGVDMAAVGWGFHTVEQLSRDLPTYIWSSPSDILPTLSSKEE